jgi:signal recognition particle subunit SEC65
MQSDKDLVKSWVKVYTSYFDKTLKYSEGRKVPLSCAVENPNIKEIFQIITSLLKLDAKAENVNI